MDDLLEETLAYSIEFQHVGFEKFGWREHKHGLTEDMAKKLIECERVEYPLSQFRAIKKTVKYSVCNF